MLAGDGAAEAFVGGYPCGGFVRLENAFEAFVRLEHIALLLASGNKELLY